MKRLTAFLLSVVLVFSLGVTALADGDTNIDGGGGGMGDGSTEGENASYWNPGNDGVRVTIVRESDRKQMTTPVDFTNISNIDPLFFGYKSKLEYKRGAKLTPSGQQYDYEMPSSPIPRIISSGGATNIAAVKQYFGQEGTLKDICEKTGFDFNDLLTKEYIVLLEPVAYFRYDGQLYAMTATEAALYDNVVAGHLKSVMGTLTHQNLPLSMFLERPDLGFPVYGGGGSGLKGNSLIISSLGLGTVRFTPPACCNHVPNCPCLKPDGSCDCQDKHPGKDCEEGSCSCIPITPDAEVYDYVFRTDTDVIISAWYNPGQEVSPDDDGRVTFNIMGKRYTKGFVCPDGDGQLVWVKWHTPKEPQVIQVPVTSNLGDSLGTISCKIEKLEENTPPHTTYYDTKPPGWRVPNKPSISYVRNNSWGEWYAEWDDCGHDECPDDCDGGEWEYEWNTYRAGLLIDHCNVFPDSRVPTAIKKGSSNWEMKSGYGVDIEVAAMASVSDAAVSEDYTLPQSAVAYFPEFDYSTYNRVLEHTGHGPRGETFEFKVNRYSYYDKRVHFTPIWYPDGAQYTVYCHVFDMWTPAGQLSYLTKDGVDIEDAMWNDYTWGNVP